MYNNDEWTLKQTETNFESFIVIGSIDNIYIFEANNVYPPSIAANQKDYLLHVLAISVDGKMHTVLWTDSPSNVPAGISSMAQTIENMASNK
jgi:hypothetical protein